MIERFIMVLLQQKRDGDDRNRRKSQAVGRRLQAGVS
jgi:hypothetical protein